MHLKRWKSWDKVLGENAIDLYSAETFSMDGQSANFRKCKLTHEESIEKISVQVHIDDVDVFYLTKLGLKLK